MYFKTVRFRVQSSYNKSRGGRVLKYGPDRFEQKQLRDRNIQQKFNITYAVLRIYDDRGHPRDVVRHILHMNKLLIDFLLIILLISEECRFQYVTCSNKSMALYMMGHISRANREIENINLERCRKN